LNQVQVVKRETLVGSADVVQLNYDFGFWAMVIRPGHWLVRFDQD